MKYSLILVLALVLSCCFISNAQENEPLEKAVQDLQKEMGVKPPVLSPVVEKSPCDQCPSKGKCEEKACEKKEVCPVTGKEGDCPKAGKDCPKDCKSCEQGKCPVTGKEGDCPKAGKDCKSCEQGKCPVTGKEGDCPKAGKDCPKDCKSCEQGKCPVTGKEGDCPKAGKDCPKDCKSCEQGKCPVTGKEGKCPKSEVCPTTGKKGHCPKAGKDCKSCEQGKCPVTGKEGKCPKSEVCPVTGKKGQCPKSEVCPVTGKKGQCPKKQNVKIVEHVYHVNIDGVMVKLTLKGNEKAIQKVLAKEIQLRKKIAKLNKSIFQVQQDLKEIYKEMGVRCPNLEKMFAHWVNQNKAWNQCNWEMLRKALDKAKSVKPPQRLHHKINPAPKAPEVKPEETKAPEVKPEETKAPEVKPEEAKAPEVKPEEANK